jgi:S1-C subfamily serine protease
VQVTGASDVRVTLGDSSSYEARVVGFDQDKDVAVLQMVENGRGVPSTAKLRPLPLGSSRTLQVGQRVYAIGNPFGLDHTLTTGVVSGLGREIQSGVTGRPIRGVIQTDAAINPGNSGGPLLDSAGRLVGINTAIYSPSGSSSGIGFAIPVDTFRGIVDQIITTGRVTRPVLGVVLAPDNTAAAQLGVRGVLVLRVPEGSPAAKAGLRGTSRLEDGTLSWGDVIQEVDGARVQDSADLYRALDGAKPGQVVTLRLLRFTAGDGRGGPAEVRATVTLGEQVTQFLRD